MGFIRWFRDIGSGDLAQVGGKNASLGEMLRHLSGAGVRVPDGFAITSAGYRDFLRHNGLEEPIRALLAERARGDVTALAAAGARIRALVVAGAFPPDLERNIRSAYHALCGYAGDPALQVAVRSSATAEDLPTASFAGQQESFLCVQGEEDLLDKVRRCYASLFTDRAISYREDMGFEHMAVALSVGVQRMVRADRGAAGVIFTLDTESGFRDVVLVTSSWGLGENVVQGRVGPDELYVHKPTLALGHAPLVWKRCGPKELRLVYDGDSHRLENVPVPAAERRRLSLSDEDALQLARWAVAIEEHYSRARGAPVPMDIEWARDGVTGELFVVQARPETVHSQRRGTTVRLYEITPAGHEVLATGLAVGEAVAAGRARVIRDPRHMKAFRPGEVLVTGITDPDWEPLLKIAAAVVTERGGRTSHAAIVARELGIPAVVGASGACDVLADAGEVTVSCAEGDRGRVYAGRAPFTVDELDPGALPRPRTRILLNVADPEKAFKLAQLPQDGVGLARMEFIYASWVKVHPLALTRHERLPEHVAREVDELVGDYPDRTEYLVDRLSQGIGTLAAAFWPRPVILRFSDFKTNEYAHLLGGAGFEPHEENPMLGWRGASRYYHPDFQDGFLLEVAAVRRVRERFGLRNLKVMIPFCRTPAEGRAVLEVMRQGGLVRGQDDLEVYVMAEIPSNVLLAEEFAALFDGFSIGSNDLTQLILGVDRDSDRVAPLFDERNEAVMRACATLIETAHRAHRKVGICGQAPSDHPEFAAFLVREGIDSISLTPDAVVRTTRRVVEVEDELRSRSPLAFEPEQEPAPRG